MADIKLFNIKGTVKEYPSGTVTLEKELQTIIENNMEAFFGVRFLASEYRTTDGGRMDSIGISRDTSQIGHWATGDVEVLIRNRADYEKAKPLIDRAYIEN